MSSRPASKGVRRQASLLVFSFGAVLLLLAVGAEAEPSPSPSVSPDPATEPNLPSRLTAKSAFTQVGSEVGAIFAKCKGAVVRIEATDLYGPHSGTGFLIDASGTIYTHYSVAGQSWNLLVEFAGKKYPAACLLADPRSGVTLLNIQAGSTPFLPLGHSTDLRIASPVITIGYPMDLPVSPTFGLVAGFDQKFLGRYLPTTHIRANVPVQSGESGAPMLNEKGEVVGILVCQFNYGSGCLGLPIQAAEKVRSDYLRFGKVRPGWIGVTAKPVGNEDEEGVRVEDLADESPAAHSGLEDGDLLVSVGQTPIRKFADLCDATFFMTADETVPIVVQRGEAKLTIQTHAVDPPGATSMALPPLFNGNSKSEGINTKLELPTPR